MIPAIPCYCKCCLVAEELNWPTEFTADPVGDRLAGRKPGLLSKYSGRVLLVTTGVCAVHCRYCFRRHFPYHEAPRGRGAWQPALDEIAADPTLSEVILSGGDPLTLVDEVLGRAGRRAGRNRPLAPSAHPHPAADHDPRARHRRAAGAAARHSAHAGRGRPRQPSGRTRRRRGRRPGPAGRCRRAAVESGRAARAASTIGSTRWSNFPSG